VASPDRGARERVAVIGAGRMGHGIAYVFAAAGHDVGLYDTDRTVLRDARSRMLRAAEIIEGDPGDVDRVRFDRQLEAAAADADLVVEAAPEWLSTKQELFERLERLVPDTTILATNTSAFPIARVSARLRHPERAIGTHFWNPPHLVPLVEVVEAPSTDNSTAERTMAILEAAGKTPVRLRSDVPGFVGNRLQHALKREAIALVAEGICDAATIDTVVKEGFGPRLGALGPLEQSDLVGLDLTLSIHRTLMPDLNQLAEPHPLLVRLVAEGRTGMAAGEGFRTWTPEDAQEAQRRLDEFLAAQGRAAAARRRERRRDDGAVDDPSRP
jgi:3-hydroxybutyryl-CoA dehydrogenase